MVCWQRGWNHICRHQDLFTALDAVRLAIEHPHEIYADADNPDRECYYLFDTEIHGQTCTLKVVVEFKALSRFLGGSVVTAYQTYDVSPGKVKRGEKKIWP